MRTHVPLVICVISGLVMLVQFFVPNQGMLQAREMYGMWIRLITGFALILGVVSLWRVALSRIRRRTEGWQFSYATIGGYTLMFCVGAFGGLFMRSPMTLELAFQSGLSGTAAISEEAGNLELVFDGESRVRKVLRIRTR